MAHYPHRGRSRLALLMRAVGANFWMDSVDAVEPLRFRRLPMLAAALCFAFGDVLARHWQQTFFLATATILSLALALVSLRWVRRVASLATLALWVVVGCWASQMEPPVPAQPGLAHYADGLSRAVRGRVVRVRVLNEDAPTEPAGHAVPLAQTEGRRDAGAWETETLHATASVDLDVEAIEDVTPDLSVMKPVSGGLRVAIDGPAPALHCGDVLEMPLRLREPETYRDPGAWSYSADLLQQGVSLQASVKATRMTQVGHGTASWHCRIYAAQAWAAQRLDAFTRSRANQALAMPLRLQPQDAAMLNAMLFGDRGGLRPSLREDFERTGTFHLFVVSGLHIVLLCGVIFWTLRRLRAPESVAVPATIALATAYAVLTGFGLPVQRALGMSAVYLVARWLAREASPLNALGTAALAVLCCDPRALFEANFQMTFLVLLAITGLAAPLRERLLYVPRSAKREPGLLRLDAHLPPRVAELRVRLRMWGALVSSLTTPRVRELPFWLLRALTRLAELLLLGIVVEVCISLPMAVYFHRVALTALPINFASVPLVALLLCLATLTFVLSLLTPWLALATAALTALLLHAEAVIVRFFAQARLSDVRVPALALPVVVACCAAIVFCCWALRSRARAGWLGGAAVLALLPLAVLWPEPPLVRPGVLEVTALDVGQGDSLLVVSPQGRTLLVDAGGPVGQAPSPDRWDVGEQVVAPYLWSRRIRRLDAVALTHAHSDHMGGMPAILRDFQPRELWLSVQPGNAPALQTLLEEARKLGINIRWFRAGDTFAWGDVQANVLSPEISYANPGGAINDDSLVLRLGFGKAGVLLEGDAEVPSENAMLAHRRLVPATLLKVGHHGSNTSTTPAFLAAVAPREAVISCGRHNTFGHPRFDVLERLEAAHVKTFRTDRAGAETFQLTTDGGISASMAASN